MYAPIDAAVRFFMRYHGELTSARDLAKARAGCGEDDSPLVVGSYTREAVVYVPQGDWLVVSHSPLLDTDNAAIAASAHRRNQEFYVGWEFIDELANEAAGQGRVLQIKAAETISIASDRLPENPLPAFLFQDYAASYGDVLHALRYRRLTFSFLNPAYVDAQRQPFVRQVLHWRFGEGVSGRQHDLHDERAIRGIVPDTVFNQRVILA